MAFKMIVYIKLIFTSSEHALTLSLSYHSICLYLRTLVHMQESTPLHVHSIKQYAHSLSLSLFKFSLESVRGDDKCVCMLNRVLFFFITFRWQLILSMQRKRENERSKQVKTNLCVSSMPKIIRISSHSRKWFDLKIDDFERKSMEIFIFSINKFQHKSFAWR